MSPDTFCLKELFYFQPARFQNAIYDKEPLNGIDRLTILVGVFEVAVTDSIYIAV